MPQEPKRKHSKARKRTRRASIMLKAVSLQTCPNCHEPKLAHIICRSCGFYKGKAVGPVKTKVKVIQA